MLRSGNDYVRTILRELVDVRLSRYDLLLWIIPAAFLLALVVSLVLSTPMERTFVAASVVGVLALFDGLFRNPPTVETSR